jgi:hypothetical protein
MLKMLPPTPETAMDRTPTLLVVLLMATSAGAFAQNTQIAPSSGTQRGAAAGQAANSASSGTSSSSGATLMQQREKGMSPDGASGTKSSGKATGKIKQ